MKKLFNKGFTLLELLVVVLIIGILVGIALPQYQLAVDKSKFAKYRTMAKSLADAYWRYLYAQNIPPGDIDDLDIDLPPGYTKTSPYNQSCAVFDDMYCCVNHPKYNYQPGSITCGAKDNSIAVHLSLLGASDADLPVNNIKNVCVAKTNNKRAVRLCESIPYKSSYTGNLLTQSSHRTGYTYYVMKN